MTTDSKWEEQELEKTQRDHPTNATAKGPFAKEGVNAFSTIWQLTLS